MATNISMAFRDGDCVVVDDGYSLPQRCVYCNVETPGSLWRMTFVDSDHRLGGLFSSLRYFATRRTARAFVGLCVSHGIRRHAMFLGRYLLFAIAAMILWIAMRQEQPSERLALVCFGAFGGGIVLALAYERLLRAKIDRGRLWIIGAGPEFLDSLRTSGPAPVWTRRRPMDGPHVFDCECGMSFGVNDRDAGSSIECDCGREIKIPSLGNLRRRAQRS